MAKKQKEQVVEKPAAEYGDFVICNNDKLERVINGVVGSQGKLVDGLGKDASPEAILAEYDRLGGLVRTRSGKKVATGSFYDFENRRPRVKPAVETEEESETDGPRVKIEKVSGVSEGEQTSRRGKKKVEEE